MSEFTELIFAKDNPCQTTITDSDTGKVLYQVDTEFAKETVTRVKDGGGQAIASWMWKNLKSDIITLGREAPVLASSWLKKGFFKNTITLKDNAGQKYEWKSNGPQMQLQLFEESNTDNGPIARFQKAHTVWNRTIKPAASTIEPARLILDERATGIQDIVVVSFLLLEKSRRLKQANAEADKQDIRTRFRTPWDSTNLTATSGDLVNMAGPSFG